MKRYFAIAISTVLLYACGNNKKAQGPGALPTTVTKPVQERVVDWDEYIGRFDASQRVEVRARISGYIEKVRFEDGQEVKKGQILFVIDQRPFEIAVQQAKADLLQAEAQFKRAKSDYDRVASIKDTRAVSREEVEQRSQLSNAAKAQYEAAKARLDLAELNLSYTEVRAPIGGRISEDFVNEGNYITGGSASATLLTTIVKLDPIYFYFEGSEADFLKYSRLDRAGQRKSSRTEHNPVMAKLLDEERYTRRGYMNFVDNELDRSTGTIQGRAIFENKDQELESGMFGRIRLLGEGEVDAILIPDDVISTNQSKKVVYVVTDSNKVQVRPIELGELYNEKYRIVKKGLSKDDMIVTGNLLKIRPGMVIDPQMKQMQFEVDSTTLL